jgi:hypothetical protein
MEILVVTEIQDIVHVPRLKKTRDNSEANVPLSSGGTTREHATTLAWNKLGLSQRQIGLHEPKLNTSNKNVLSLCSPIYSRG